MLVFSTSKGISSDQYDNRIKRLLDIMVSFAGVVICIHVIILTSLLVKLTSSGPVFYEQIPVGLNENQFFTYKFCSMKIDAWAKGAVWAEKMMAVQLLAVK